jgi:hypothetical protein
METNKHYYFSNITEKSNEIWGTLFNMTNRTFRKKGYQFHHMMKTDGISCSILFIKLDENNKPCKIPKIGKKQRKLLIENNDCEYIEDVVITQSMKNKLLVAIDPNHGNLNSCLAEIETTKEIKNIICTNSNNKTIKSKNKNHISFRYTRSQRNKETKNDKYKKIRENLKGEKKIGNKNVEQIETELAIHDSKICDFNKFNCYLNKKIEVNRILYEHYEDPIFRKLKMNLYINTQKSESKMIKNFKKIYGSPNNVLIVYGDYDKIDTMKGCEPHISKRLRKLYKRHGYEIYKINEFHTSKLCNKCCKELERFKILIGKDGKEHLLWGLLRRFVFIFALQKCNTKTTSGSGITFLLCKNEYRTTLHKRKL